MFTAIWQEGLSFSAAVMEKKILNGKWNNVSPVVHKAAICFCEHNRSDLGYRITVLIGGMVSQAVWPCVGLLF
jgi:hypothetical protein